MASVHRANVQTVLILKSIAIASTLPQVSRLSKIDLGGTAKRALKDEKDSERQKGGSKGSKK